MLISYTVLNALLNGIIFLVPYKVLGLSAEISLLIVILFYLGSIEARIIMRSLNER